MAAIDRAVGAVCTLVSAEARVETVLTTVAWVRGTMALHVVSSESVGTRGKIARRAFDLRVHVVGRCNNTVVEVVDTTAAAAGVVKLPDAGKTTSAVAV